MKNITSEFCLRLCSCAVAFSLAIGSVLAGDIVTVKLSGGAQLTATLLQATDDRVVLDLGHEVVTVDRKRVLSMDNGEKQAKGQTSDREFYTLGRLDEMPVPQLVKKIGDAVVTVSTPGGMGSGF